MPRDLTVYIDQPLSAAVIEIRRRAMQAIHVKVNPSRHAFRLGSASDPILAMASAPAPIATEEDWRRVLPKKRRRR